MVSFDLVHFSKCRDFMLVCRITTCPISMFCFSFSMIPFFQLYLTTMLQPLKTVRLVHPLFCLVVFSIPYMVGLERVVYHEAHWIDVIAGWVLGALAALYMVTISSSFEDFFPKGDHSWDERSMTKGIKEKSETSLHTRQDLQWMSYQQLKLGLQ